MNNRIPQNYLEMIRAIPPQREALITDGTVYTYGSLAAAAEERQRELGVWAQKQSGTAQSSGQSYRRQPCQSPAGTPRSLHLIREARIARQLIDFLALSGTRLVPMIVPQDANPDPAFPGESSTSSQIPSSACMAVLTSGTCGQAKILYRSFASWYNYFTIQNQIFDMNADTRLFLQGSLAFTGNLNLCLAQLAAGGTVIAESQPDPRIWLQRIRTCYVNGIYLIPSKLRLLEKLCRQEKRRIVNPHILTIISGSQSLGRSQMMALKRHFPNAALTLYYGASELSYLTYVKDCDMKEDASLIGRPFPEVDLRLENGQFLVSTAYAAIGYETDACIGDCGHQDEDGLFYFDGRADDILNLHGRKISALRIENALLSLRGIDEAAVQIIREGGREYLATWLTADESCRNEQQIRARLRSLLPEWELPRRFYFVFSLPRTESGKIRKERKSE